MNLKKSVPVFFIFLLFNSILGFGQTDTVTIEQPSYVFLDYTNDYFNGEDRYYTQGIQIEVALPEIAKSPFRKMLIGSKNETGSSQGLFIKHEAFSPTSIRSEDILYGDHPFGCAVFAGQNRVSLNDEKNTRISSDFTVGSMGRIGKCKEIQTGIHKATGNRIPFGWQHQLAADFILNYHVRFEKGLFVKKNIEFQTFADARVGSYLNNARVGIATRVGKIQSYFKPINQHKTSKVHIYMDGEAYVEAVGYNASMQGGLFSTSVYTIPSSDVTRVIVGASARVVLAFKRWSLMHYKTWRTSAFLNASHHGWGYIKIKYFLNK